MAVLDHISRLRLLSLSLVAATALSACGGGSTDSGTTTEQPPPSGGTPTESTPQLSGSFVLGPVTGAAIKAYVLNADGSRGGEMGSGSTGTTGTFSFKLSATPSGAVLLEASGGSYQSETDGSVISNTAVFRRVVASVGSGGVSGIAITAMSELVTSRMVASVASGTSLTAALDAANGLISGAYSIDAAGTPSFEKSAVGTGGYTLGVVLGALETCAKNLSPSVRTALYTALSEDISDGVFDGKKSGMAVSLGTGVLASTAGTSDFLTCVSSYTTSGKAVTDAGLSSSDLSSTVSAIRTAVAASPSTPKSTGLTAGTSGAIATLAYGGKQWIFLAARAQGVVAVDVTDPTAAAPTVKRYSSIVTNFGGTAIGGVVPMIGADHPQLLVYSYNSKHVALMNADTGTVEYETNLPLLATAPISFSGGSAYIAGAIPDTGRDGAWLATADGYVFFDRASRTLTTSFSIASPADLAENLGADVSSGYLFAPNYEPGVQYVDLAKNKSYYLGGTSFSKYFPSFREPDGGAVDSGYQVGVITDEDTSQVGLINLRGLVMTDVAGGRSLFTPAAGGYANVNLSGPILSGSAVDSETHLALFMAGYSSDVAVGLIEDPASVAAGSTWKGLSDWRFVRGMTGFSYAKDPHAVAVLKNASNKKSYGYLLDGTARKVFQIDMAAFLAAPSISAGTSKALATDPTTNGIVRSVSW